MLSSRSRSEIVHESCSGSCRELPDPSRRSDAPVVDVVVYERATNRSSGSSSIDRCDGHICARKHGGQIAPAISWPVGQITSHGELRRIRSTLGALKFMTCGCPGGTTVRGGQRVPRYECSGGPAPLRSTASSPLDLH